MVTCQGIYPISAAQLDPVDAVYDNHGRHACHRGTVCTACFHDGIRDFLQAEEENEGEEGEDAGEGNAAGGSQRGVRTTPGNITASRRLLHRKWSIVENTKFLTARGDRKERMCYYCSVCTALQRNGTCNFYDVWGHDTPSYRYRATSE